MNKEVTFRVLKTAASLLAMFFIWQLTKAALESGIDGVVFFLGVAALAGLGGYELSWITDVIKSKIPSKKNDG